MTRCDQPNLITLLRLGVGIATAVLIVLGFRTALVLALLLHVAIYALDGLDGRFARAAGLTRAEYARRVGGFLDGAIDGIVFSIVAIALMRKGLILHWAVETVVGSRMLLMTVRGAAALGDGSPLGPTRLTRISGGALGVGSFVVLLEPVITGSLPHSGPTELGIVTSAIVSVVVIVSLLHYLATLARETLRSMIAGPVGGTGA
jgi:phosphatidylglycerophosphate synthase